MSWQPALNASLNALSGILVLCGWVMIRRRNVRAHMRFMLAAVACSVLFLVSYVVYHARVGSTEFPHRGWIRPVYYGILLSHTVLAATLLPMIGVVVVRALKGRFPEHRRIARFAAPIWLYVSVTGVLVYLLLYHW